MGEAVGQMRGGQATLTTQPCAPFFHVLRQGHPNPFGLAVNEKSYYLAVA